MSLLKPLNAELNPICHLLALLGAHHILYISEVKVKNTLCFLLETTLSHNHTQDRRVASFTCQFCTTTLTMLAAL
jgi:hypothetical protein